MQKSHCILYSPAMAIAKAQGIKSQTRRIMNPQPSDGFCPTVGLYHPTMIDKRTGEAYPGKEVFGASDENEGYPCKYGAPGDHLFGKESFSISDHPWHGIIPGLGSAALTSDVRKCDSQTYRLTGNYTSDDHWFVVALSLDESEKFSNWTRKKGGHSSMFMFKSLCRIRDEITEVRAERLQDISEADAKAEGIERIRSIGPLRAMGWKDYSGGAGFMSAIDSYRTLWNCINLDPKPIMAMDTYGTGKKEIAGYIAYPWNSYDFECNYPGVRAKGLFKGKSLCVVENPWVWVISTKPIAGGSPQ